MLKQKEIDANFFCLTNIKVKIYNNVRYKSSYNINNKVHKYLPNTIGVM